MTLHISLPLLHIAMRQVVFLAWVTFAERKWVTFRKRRSAPDVIRQSAADNPAVLIRLLSTIGRLAPKLQGAEDRSALVEQAAAVWETANTKPLVKMDREDIEATWQKTRTAVASFEVRETVGLDVTP
jgi:uncharacterized membrane protein